MELIDTHAHLTSPELAAQFAAVLARARAAGVGRIVAIASDAADAEAAQRLATAHADIYSSAGIHPHQAARVVDGDLERVGALWAESKTIAVGEIGLDYFYDFADKPSQQRVFAEQLERAVSANLPLIIHCRDAFDDCIAMLERYGYRGRKVVFHCFTGSRQDAARVAEFGWRISFTGIVTFRRSVELREIAREYPADQLMLETDSPYLSPEPVRSIRPNEPAHVAHTARFLARLRNTPEEEFAARTTANARAFFDLPM